MFPLPSILPVAYKPSSGNATRFNGSNQYLYKSTNFGGFNEYGYCFSCVFRVNQQSILASRMLFSSGGWVDGNGDDRYGFNIGITAQTTAANSKYRIFLSASYNSDDFGMPGATAGSITTGFTFDRDVWMHVLVGFSADAFLAMVVNDTDTYSSADLTSFPASFYQDSGNCTAAIGYTATGPAYLSPCPVDIANLYFSAGTEQNPTDTTFRRYFINANKSIPADIGANGVIGSPYFASPTLYIKGTSGAIATNIGSAGNFTKVGTPTDISATIIAGQP